MLADVRDRLLGDAEQLGLGLRTQPLGGLVELDVDGQVGRRPDCPDVVGQRPAQAVAGQDLAAQVEDRQPDLADDAGQLPAA